MKSLGMFVTAAIVVGQFAKVQAINFNNTVWNTNWNIMSFWQTGDQVSGEYMYDDGVLTGTLYGDTLKGWWREVGNTKECGPGGTSPGNVLS